MILLCLSLKEKNGCQKSAKSQQKVRHHSSALPSGFQVAEKVKQKIIGRLRASSHACDDFNKVETRPSPTDIEKVKTPGTISLHLKFFIIKNDKLTRKNPY